MSRSGDDPDYQQADKKRKLAINWKEAIKCVSMKIELQIEAAHFLFVQDYLPKWDNLWSPPFSAIRDANHTSA